MRSTSSAASPRRCCWGSVLGPMMEENLRRALLLSCGDWTTFATRPLSAALLLAAIVLVVIVTLPSIKAQRELAFQEAD
jgi:putative tricarboxylic transport membrane protein